MGDLENPDDTFAVSHSQHSWARVDCNAGQLQIRSGFVSLLSWICKRVVKTFDNINVWERPSVSEVSPDKHTHVFSTSDEGVHRLRGVLDASFVNSWFCDPLQPGDLLEMPKLMAHDCLGGTVNWPIDHHKRLIWVLDHEVSHVECSGHKSNRGPYFEYGELITLQVVIDILVVLVIQQLVRSASCPHLQGLVQGWVSV
jgi:hypothetical protein